MCVYILIAFHFLYKTFFNHYLEAHFSMRHFPLCLHNEVCLFTEASCKTLASYSLVSDFRELLQLYDCIALYVL